MRSIIAEGIIRAHDQNKVFVERAARRKLSPADARAKYRLKRGKGNAYVEFDVEDHAISSRLNSSIGIEELSIEGDVDLTDRDAEGFFNF